ncbi:hypothetical protein Ahy_A09g046298 [Arachis hypogaea]|uniref:Uncharacterized protein n=1 Tax=Arachis hypogaea TaxID=3818 RepID=A0A445BPE3_ARAHY|nr:hypothetical protein Ahy_A09g046298 [Arachis hypogaea]
MDDSTSDCQQNQSEMDFEFKSNEVSEPLCDVDEQFVLKVGMTFNTLEDVAKLYKNYSKAEDIDVWIISKVVLHHSHLCCANQAEMLKQHKELSMSVRRTIENNEKVGIRLNKTYQSFVAVLGGHCELNFIKKDARNYTTREVRNISKLESAKEFGKYLLRMKEKNQNFFFELELEDDQSIKLAFWTDARSRAACEYFKDIISFNTTYNANRYNLVFYSFVEMNHHELYEGCHIWISIYLDHHFWTGMRSTQKSESMHVFFNKFIMRNISLIQFVKQYDNCLESREQRERESDTADFHTVIPCATKSSIEAQFQQVYIYQKFKKVQTQFRGKMNCITRSTNSALGYSIYEIVEQVSNSTFNKFAVTYNSVAAQVKCQYLVKRNIVSSLPKRVKL